MEEFLHKCKKICGEVECEADRTRSLAELRSEVLAKDNAYIKTLLSQ